MAEPAAATPSTSANTAGAFWKRHPVDIRFSLPLLGGWFYVTVVSGPERRSAERRQHDRHGYPLRTAANVFFVLGIAAAFYAVALIVFAFATSIIEW
jgi:hypothetical protein